MSNDKVRASDYPEFGIRAHVRREERDIAGVMTVTIDGRCVHGDLIEACERDHGANAVPGPTGHSTQTKVLGSICFALILILTGLLSAWGFDVTWHAGLGWLAVAIGVIWTGAAVLIITSTIFEVRK
ncbi:hypothetical protein SEA_SHROOMS_75 [Arthrobacter phage Shrooms]|nr:hypothetical protein SEA_SHROOMS_75 [Arthrobacter phage Shrooms]